MSPHTNGVVKARKVFILMFGVIVSMIGTAVDVVVLLAGSVSRGAAARRVRYQNLLDWDSDLLCRTRTDLYWRSVASVRSCTKSVTGWTARDGPATRVSTIATAAREVA
jgi:hypothetical protein